ncbi:MAG: M15 family metallopeptidase [Candidatus Eremiobacteraeota bacterium]|nr:M15 family metallopeptidase [Candidatus Eremiobacteraeota bacterium]
MTPLLRATLLALSSMLAVIPNGFTYLASLAPQIRQDIRYATPNNFTGARVPGYDAPSCILTTPAADALVRVERTLLKHYLTLRVYDCYRPKSAVDAFVAWSKRPNDLRDQALYYPHVPKSDLFARGYISERSSHSRGSTVDLTIDGLAMGTPYDYFDPLSRGGAPVPTQARANRMFLAMLMERYGFKPYPEEWWHFTLAREPFPARSFNFPITAQHSR